MQLFRRRSAVPTTGALPAILLIAALAGCWIGCDSGTMGGSEGSDAGHSLQRFRFSQTPQRLVRVDGRTGQVWSVPRSGEGGWIPIGGPAEMLGESTLPDRFRIYTLAASRQQGRDSTEKLLRVDAETGRSWTIEMLDGAIWNPIDDPDDATFATQDIAPTTTETANLMLPPQPTSGADLIVVPRNTIEADEAGASEFATNLIQALQKDGMPPGVQAWSARQLGQFPPDIAVPPLLAALSSDQPDVVAAAILALRETGDRSVIPKILELQNHPDPAVRAAVQEVVVEVQ